jgi:hypothetical protein
MISTLEEVDKIDENIRGYYYRPESYLSKYLFTKEILLDVFCSQYLVTTFEDDYYDDFCIDMVAKYQPHIDVEEFLKLWKDLDEILVVEQFCRYIINYPKYVVKFLYNSINKYIEIPIYEFIELMISVLNENKYIIKLETLKNKIIDITNINADHDHNNKIDDFKKIANEILLQIPARYSSILPL